MYLVRGKNNRPNIIHQYGDAYIGSKYVHINKIEINDASHKATINKTFLEYVRMAKDFMYFTYQ